VPIYSIPATANRLRLLEEHGEPIAPITHPAEFSLESEDDYVHAMSMRGAREPTE
jgi:sulfite oxidase